MMTAAAALAAAPAALAHHSVAGVFDTSQTTTWRGVISGIDWINPHTYVHLDVTNEDGTVTTWALESIPPAMLRRAGITRDMVLGNEGEVVEVEGLRARNGADNLGYILTITYEDGHFYQLSTN
jgi:hypothetical protein